MEKTTKRLAKWLDDRLPFNEWLPGLAGVAVEAIDGKVFAWSLEFAIRKLDKQYKDDVLVYIDALLDKDYETIKSKSSERLVEILKTPLGDKKERIIIGGIVGIIFELIEDEKLLVAGSIGGGGDGDEDPGGNG